MNLIISIFVIILIVVAFPFGVKRLKKNKKKNELVLNLMTGISLLLLFSGQVLGSLFSLKDLPIYMDLAGLAVILISIYWYAKTTTAKQKQR